MTGIVQSLIGSFGSVVSAATDAYFYLVTLLLPGNGTNGAQNNTFLDSSSNNFTITRNGNTTQGTFSPFSQTGWSMYVGSNTGPSAVSYGGSTSLALGAGDFCAEAFVYMTSAAAGAILDWRTNGGTTANIPVLYVNSSGVPIFEGTGGSVLITGSSAVPLNTWAHIALVRSGTTITIYLNGVSVGTATSNTTNFGISTFNVNNPQSVAFSFVGYISNVRIVKGSPVYTGAFTPPTAPLTAITNTQLLTCQSNRFVDNSSNAFAITVNGTPSVQAFSPFAPTAAYSAATNGGSGYFDGSGDYLVMATASAAINPSTSTTPFTIECWVYNTGTSSTVLFSALGSENYGFVLGFGSAVGTYDSTQTPWFANYTGSWNGIRSTTAIPRNAWTHLACVFTGSTSYIYQDGVMRASGGPTTWGVTGSSKVRIGCRVDATTDTFTGYISGARVVIGSNLYPSGTTFTPPTAPPTAVTNTQLLTNFTNAGITDVTSKNDAETGGNAQISTTQSKWGGSSVYFDGAGDYIRFQNGPNQNFAFGTGDFTVEGWIYLNASTDQTILDIYDGNSAGRILFVLNTSRQLAWLGASAGNRTTTTSAISLSTWTHFAVCRASGSTRIFIGGTQGNTTYIDTNNYTCTTGVVVMGINGSDLASAPLNAYLDDFRISKYARYTANFTPPTAAFALQ